MIFIGFLSLDLEIVFGSLIFPFFDPFGILVFVCVLTGLFFHKCVSINLLDCYWFDQHLKLGIGFAFGNHLLFGNGK